MIHGGVISTHPTFSSKSSNVKDGLECSYLVQLQPTKKAEREHFEFLKTQSNLIDGVQQKWHIGQTFQGYHMNLCQTIVKSKRNEQDYDLFTQQLQSQYQILENAPHILALEQDQEVTQTGWIHEEDESQNEDDETPLDDEKSIEKMIFDKDNHSVQRDDDNDNMVIAGQQAGTIACQNDATWSLYRVGSAKVDLPTIDSFISILVYI